MIVIRVRPEYREPGFRFRLHDNAHSVTNERRFQAKRQTCPSAVFARFIRLFFVYEIKSSIKRDTFCGTWNPLKPTRIMENIPKTILQKSFERLIRSVQTSRRSVFSIQIYSVYI